MKDTYQDLLARKRISFQPRGFDPPDLHPSLKPFQRAVTEFSIATGASAMFLDTGLGKSFSGLEWGALRANRKFIGVELKPEYFAQAVKNLQDAAQWRGTDLFAATA